MALGQVPQQRRSVALIAVFQVASVWWRCRRSSRTPERLLISTGEWKVAFFKDEIGWPELTHQTEVVWVSLPAAGTRRRRGPRRELRRSGSARALRPRRLPLVVSGHLSWRLAAPTAPAALPRDRRCRSGNAPLPVQQLAPQSDDRQPCPPRQRGARPDDRQLHAAPTARRRLAPDRQQHPLGFHHRTDDFNLSRAPPRSLAGPVAKRRIPDLGGSSMNLCGTSR